MDNYQVVNDIVEAIKYKKEISFDYNEPDEVINTLRIGFPHAIYIQVSTRNILLDLYQIDGQSSNIRNIPSWRQFNIKRISNINISKEITFDIQKGYNPNLKKYFKVIAKV